MICSIYGYLLATSRDYCKIRPCTSVVDCLRLSAHHTFKGVQIVSENLSFFQMNRATIRYKNAIVCGFTVLELSKLHLYRGLDLVKHAFSNSRLIFAQTDSLAIAIKDPADCYLQKLKSLGD